MADSVAAPSLLERPPRTTGNAQEDFPLVIDWMWKAYQVINASVEYIKSQITNITNIANKVDASLVQGIVQVSDTNSSGSVTFTTAQSDANYVIILQAKTVSGAPATGAYTISSKTYTPAGFTFTILAAPGAGTSITFEWQLVRNINV